MCEKHICNPDTKEPVWKMCTRCKLLLCFVLSARRPAIQAKLGDHLVIAMCSAVKPYFLTCLMMPSDVDGGSPLSIWAQLAQTADTLARNTCMIHLYGTLARYVH